MTAVAAATAIVVALVLVRVPIAFALLTGGVLGIWWIQGLGQAAVALGRLPYQTPSNYVLVMIPLFIVMGVFARQGSIAQDGFTLAARLTHRIPGGLAVATVLACAAFAAISGSSVATISTLGPMAYEQMEKRGYDSTIALGTIASAGTLGVLIPPSVGLVIYGIVSGESVGALLLAGVIPGVLSAVIYGIVLAGRAIRYPDKMGGLIEEVSGGRGGSTAPRSAQLRVGSDRSTLQLTASAVKVLVIFTVVVGGIYSGRTSTTEAAGMGALFALLFFIGDLIGKRRGSGRVAAIVNSVAEATRTTSMAFALLIGAAVFTYLLVIARVPDRLAGAVADLALPGAVIVIIILLIFVPLGMFMDPLSILLIAVPIVHPAVTGLGYDGIWFAILVVKMIEVGLITPPMGMNAFVVAGVIPDATVNRAFRGALWFLPADLFTIALLFSFPILVTWLPTLAS